MLPFNRFATAAATIRGVELAAKIKKGQFSLPTLTGKVSATPEIWVPVLAP